MSDRPRRWPNDGGARRERWHDPLDGRLLGIAAWTTCLGCDAPIFSADVRRFRLCPECRGDRDLPFLP